jgi:hypothetical protein
LERAEGAATRYEVSYGHRLVARSEIAQPSPTARRRERRVDAALTRIAKA